MSTGEKTLYEWTAANVANANLQPNTAVMLDIANSGNGIACKLPTGAGVPPLGIVTDKIRLSIIDGTVEPGQNVSFADIGRKWCIAASAIAIGDKVVIANVAGQVQTKVQAGAGVVPQPVVGTAETVASGINQGVLVRLEIGGTW